MLPVLLLWLGLMCCRSWSTEPRLTTGRPPNQNDATDPNSWCRLTRNSCRLPLFTMSCRFPSLREQKSHVNNQWCTFDAHCPVYVCHQQKIWKTVKNYNQYLTHVLCWRHFVIKIFYLLEPILKDTICTGTLVTCLYINFTTSCYWMKVHSSCDNKDKDDNSLFICRIETWDARGPSGWLKTRIRNGISTNYFIIYTILTIQIRALSRLA